ncbi:hypothetical protein DQ04_05091010, partial [Trypanosoma grayi]|uniref:hypothetical protein n=1 Tax=Trypanosoma grayi TaxID=71804 RepID=UPI0004F46689
GGSEAGGRTYRERLSAFYGKYAPNKLGQVDAQLEKYAGREEDFLAALVQKYGPEPEVTPAAPPISCGGSEAGGRTYRERLTAFYGKYAPNKLGQVDAQLEKYAGREEDFLAALVQKYGPEPEVTPAASASAVEDETGSNSPTHAGSSTMQEFLPNSVMPEANVMAAHIEDKERQGLVRELAVELGVAVESYDTVVALEALLDAKTVMAVTAA